MSDPGTTDPWGNPIPPSSPPHQPSSGQQSTGNPSTEHFPQTGQSFFPPDPNVGQPQGSWNSGGTWQTPNPTDFPHIETSRIEGTAIGSLVLGIVGLLLCGIILEPIAIILGFQARRKIRASNGALKGEGLAAAGIVLGFIGTALAIIGIVILVQNPDLMDSFIVTSTTTSG